ncbi:DUF6157 family protein [Cellulomonas xylanilytica]|uniref:Uncharacterized protein n=1 Tax=Cellulomonas xylanilytica TaxID=233583 RepID=A0A510V0C5_9CELL|nr:DUF6157 family protein [Cellulomonas xylanilytica]GEK20363.1 hypothetical protein CXY01_08830 [Cellulomonas xylanilytica]
MESVDYTSTFITVAPDTRAVAGVEPTGTTIAAATYSLIASDPYALRSSDVIFQVWASRHDVDASSADEWATFYAKSHACLRSSDLGKRYGWGIHADADGRLAVYAVGSDEYSSLAAGTAPDGSAVTVRAAMRSSRR